MKKVKLTTSIKVLFFQFLVSISILGQTNNESLRINDPLRIYINGTFGYPISFLTDDARNIIKNDLNLKLDFNNSLTYSVGTLFSNVKNNFGGKFCFSYLDQSFKSDSLLLNLDLLSMNFGLNYRLTYKKWLFDFDVNMGTLMSYQGLTFKNTEIQDLYQSIDNQQGNYAYINSKPIFNLAFTPRVHYKVHPFFSFYLNYEYRIANNSKLGKFKNQTLFSNQSIIYVGMEVLLNQKKAIGN
jgi:hypothetical protein